MKSNRILVETILVTIVAIDLFSIFVDSILYGNMYARSKNLILVWVAHLMGDILGMFFLLRL